MSNVLVGSDHASGIEISAGGTGLAGQTLWLRAQADGITLTQADSGKLVTPADGGGEVTLLADPVAGTEYDFATVADESPLTIRAQGLHKIMLAGNVGEVAVGGVGGLRLRLAYVAPNAWVGHVSGFWDLS